jgi:hypothetical protein
MECFESHLGVSVPIFGFHMAHAIILHLGDSLKRLANPSRALLASAMHSRPLIKHIIMVSSCSGWSCSTAPNRDLTIDIFPICLLRSLMGSMCQLK